LLLSFLKLWLRVSLSAHFSGGALKRKPGAPDRNARAAALAAGGGGNDLLFIFFCKLLKRCFLRVCVYVCTAIAGMRSVLEEYIAPAVPTSSGGGRGGAAAASDFPFQLNVSAQDPKFKAILDLLASRPTYLDRGTLIRIFELLLFVA
jgi:hypothetical protein